MMKRTTYDPSSGEERYEPPRKGDEPSAWNMLGLLLWPFIAAWWLIKHWPITLPTAVVLYAWARLGTIGLIMVAVVVLAMGLGWRLAHPASFHLLVAEPYRRRRRKRTYRNAWVETMHNAGLSRGYGATRVAPRIAKIRFDPWTDKLLVQMLAGQSIDELRKQTDALKDTFGGLRCDIVPEPGGRWAGRVWVNIGIRDRLEDVVLPILPADPVDLSDLTIGLREDGSPWTVSLTNGQHLFIAGATDAGKSSVEWSILNALGPGDP